MWFPHFRHGQHDLNKNRYTNAELADIHFIYCLTNGNECVVVRLFGERYQTRLPPNHRTFTWVHQNQAEHASFRAMINDMPMNSEMDLVVQLSIAVATIREAPGIFEHVHQSIWRRYYTCKHANSSNFKHFLG
ncbi:hypothetical protein TNCV_2971331 [Trichonephila clavipes]|nr:hypothetical protein TNCV_2971331 [Trichonephila clavipes]